MKLELNKPILLEIFHCFEIYSGDLPINSLYPMNLLLEAKGNPMMLKTIKENRNQDCV